jgi:hypothetical protein
MIIPMYVYPADIEGLANGEAAWMTVCESPVGDDGPTYVVANVFNGPVNPQAIAPKPGDPSTADGFADPQFPSYRIKGSDRTALTVDPNYEKIIRRCSASTRVLGYVSTAYGTVPIGSPGSFDPATVLGQVALWHLLYPGISGIFLDEVTSNPITASQTRYYEAIGSTIDDPIVANVGAPPGSDWLLANGAADLLIVYEGDASRFATIDMPEWVSDHPASTFGTILHNARSPAQVREICARSWRQNIGSLYITDGRIETGNPYNGLPSEPIWRALLDC